MPSAWGAEGKTAVSQWLRVSKFSCCQRVGEIEITYDSGNECIQLYGKHGKVPVPSQAAAKEPAAKPDEKK